MEAQKKVGLNIWKMKVKNIHNSYKSFENIEFPFYNSFYKRVYLKQLLDCTYENFSF